MRWFDERLYIEHLKKGYAQSFEVTRFLARKRSPFQNIAIFETATFGRVLALDGIIQVTEADEFVYHEMLTHLPIMALGKAKDVLIIGAGDGGILREVLRHKQVKSAVMVEIDGAVIDLCKRFMPSLNGGAFDDPRADVIVGDGIDYVMKSKRDFDLIVCDSTDPIGPGEVLFTDAFYRNCRRLLAKRKGVLVTQNGVPFFQPDEVKTTKRRLGRIFEDMGFFYAVVPTYIGGMMTLAWASDDPKLRKVPEATIAKRWKKAGLKTRYYSPGIHASAFKLPPFIADLAGK